MKKQTKCYIYTRVSTAMQVDGYSLDAHYDRKILDLQRRYVNSGKNKKYIIVVQDKF